MNIQSPYDCEFVEDPFNPDSEVLVLKQTWLFGRNNAPRRGKVKDVYEINHNYLVIYFTDRISAFDVVLPSLIPYKGYSLTGLSAYWFREGRKIYPNHLVDVIDINVIKVLKTQRIDIEWIARKYLYGSLWREYSRGRREFYGTKLPEGLNLAQELPDIIVTPTTKSEIGHDREISKEDAIRRGLLTRDEWKELEEITIKLFEFYERKARQRGIILADLKLEFGRYGDMLIQIDEPPTHDSARLWIEEDYEEGRLQVDNCLDKEYLREYLRRIGFRGDGKPPKLSRKVVIEVSKRCMASYLVLSGRKSIKDFSFTPINEVIK